MIAKCAICGYDRRAHRAVDSCPECGLTWNEAVAEHRRRVRVCICCLPLPAFGLLANFALNRALPQWIDLAIIVLAVVASAWVGTAFGRHWMCRRFEGPASVACYATASLFGIVVNLALFIAGVGVFAALDD